jgi:hypothetical protein
VPVFEVQRPIEFLSGKKVKTEAKIGGFTQPASVISLPVFLVTNYVLLTARAAHTTTSNSFKRLWRIFSAKII